MHYFHDDKLVRVYEFNMNTLLLSDILIIYLNKFFIEDVKFINIYFHYL